MKEAAGEANMTVITLVLIGVVAAIATPIITSVVNSTKRSACCQSLGGVWENGSCTGVAGWANDMATVDTLCP
ncbi:MAG: hypothetical protein E7173_01705 [Firmicutes bacterium]|nr:hypothetical protein [Bacillota bacterium]